MVWQPKPSSANENILQITLALLSTSTGLSASLSQASQQGKCMFAAFPAARLSLRNYHEAAMRSDFLVFSS